MGSNQCTDRDLLKIFTSLIDSISYQSQALQARQASWLDLLKSCMTLVTTPLSSSLDIYIDHLQVGI